jgi:hypothetical protein
MKRRERRARTKDESKVSGTGHPRHFQCKKCRFDGLKNETNNSRRFTARCSRAFDRKIAHLDGAGDLLHCGISVRRMTAQGQSLRIDTAVTCGQRPLHLQ